MILPSNYSESNLRKGKDPSSRQIETDCSIKSVFARFFFNFQEIEISRKKHCSKNVNMNKNICQFGCGTDEHIIPRAQLVFRKFDWHFSVKWKKSATEVDILAYFCLAVNLGRNQRLEKNWIFEVSTNLYLLQKAVHGHAKAFLGANLLNNSVNLLIFRSIEFKRKNIRSFTNFPQSNFSDQNYF